MKEEGQRIMMNNVVCDTLKENSHLICRIDQLFCCSFECPLFFDGARPLRLVLGCTLSVVVGSMCMCGGCRCVTGSGSLTQGGCDGVLN